MKPVGVAVIGAGQRAIMFSKYLAEHPEQVRLVGYAEPVPGKAAILRDYFHLKAEIHGGFESLVAHPEVEAVMIGTPDYLHVAPTVEALRLGKHVYLEKPMATTLADCDAIVAAAKTSRGTCYVGFNLRHSPVYERVHRMIRDGRVGRVTTIEANEMCCGGPWFYFREWHRFRKYSGGLWMTKAVHDFDILTWMAAAQPRKLYATSHLTHYRPIEGAGPRCRDCRLAATCPDYYDVNEVRSEWIVELWRQLETTTDQHGEFAPDNCVYNTQKDTFDNGSVLIEYDNDVKATYTVNTMAARVGRQMRVIGTKGMIESEFEDREYVTFTPRPKLLERSSGGIEHHDVSAETVGTHSGADDKIFGDFFRICREGGTPRSTVLDGRLAVEMSVRATESDDTDKVVYF